VPYFRFCTKANSETVQARGKKVKKVKLTLEKTTKAQGWSRGIALLFL